MNARGRRGDQAMMDTLAIIRCALACWVIATATVSAAVKQAQSLLDSLPAQ